MRLGTIIALKINYDHSIYQLRAFTMMVLKILAFHNSKNYFIYFNTLFYNTPNINDSIFLPLHLNILFLFFSLFFYFLYSLPQ